MKINYKILKINQKNKTNFQKQILKIILHSLTKLNKLKQELSFNQRVCNKAELIKLYLIKINMLIKKNKK